MKTTAPADLADLLSIAEEVVDAIAEGRPTVALESSVIAQGLPRPDNLETAGAMETAVRQAGAVPATTALIDGRIKVGLSAADLELLATYPKVVKVGPRDIAPTLAAGRVGGTTVAVTLIAASRAAIPVMATGGIGGVHRGASETFDLSADFRELAQNPVAVVTSGAKSVLDLPKTLEILETLGVVILGFRTDEFPAFHAQRSELQLSWRIETATEAACVLKHQRILGLRQSVLIANPVPQKVAVPEAALESWTQQATDECAASGLAGKAVTPFLLKRLNDLSGGLTLKANKALLLENARLAAEIADAYSNL